MSAVYRGHRVCIDKLMFESAVLSPKSELDESGSLVSGSPAAEVVSPLPRATPMIESQCSSLSTVSDTSDDLTALLYKDGYTMTQRFGGLTGLSLVNAIFRRYLVDQ